MDEISRAYATLGVPAGTPLAGIRKQYKALVRKWHPDRFAADPHGQAEATTRMRAINDAFRLVAERTIHETGPRSAAPDQRSSPHQREPPFGRRLTRDEIDRMVDAMKNDGPFDWMFDASIGGWRERPYHSTEDFRRNALAGLLAAATVFPLLAVAAALKLPERATLWLVLAGGYVSFLFLRRALPK